MPESTREMTTVDIRGKRVLVVGLARSGIAAAALLRLEGAVVTVTDARPAPEFSDQLPQLLAQKVGIEIGVHQLQTFLNQDLIVVSPGVPWDLPQLREARKRGIQVYPEVEVASWFLQGTLVGITGTNGKTTTTTLLGRVFEVSGFPTFVGGNIGVPLITAVNRIPEDSILVVELSSFQLEAAQDFRPHVAVLLNLTPNHLDRHPSFEAYVSAKAQIFRNQTAEDYAILNADDHNVMALAPAIASTKVFFSRQRELPDGVFLDRDNIVYRVRNLERVILRRQDVRLRGDFNLENVMAATAAACVLGVEFEAIRDAVADFRGVEHRLEFVREILGIDFYNDSKATSVDATVNALSAFEGGVHLILGGKDKGAPYEPLRGMLEGRVKHVYLVGAAAERIAKELAGAAEFTYSGDLEIATRQAFEHAEPRDVVLLAPACSSFDQFRDFEHRGQAFKDSVELLARKAKHVRPGTRGDELFELAPTEPIPDKGPEERVDREEEAFTADMSKLTVEADDERSVVELPASDLDEARVQPAVSYDLNPAEELAQEAHEEITDFVPADSPAGIPGSDLLSRTAEATESDLEPSEPRLVEMLAAPDDDQTLASDADLPASEMVSPFPAVSYSQQLDHIFPYEVSGQEMPPQDIEIREEDYAEYPIDTLGPLEMIQDEPLPYEYVAVSSTAAAGSQGLTLGTPGPARKRGGRKRRSTSSSDEDPGDSGDSGAHGPAT
jgi:UDP-N-acetylmuramoylalanine--D-glutamate ligase